MDDARGGVIMAPRGIAGERLRRRALWIGFAVMAASAHGILDAVADTTSAALLGQKDAVAVGRRRILASYVSLLLGAAFMLLGTLRREDLAFELAPASAAFILAWLVTINLLVAFLYWKPYAHSNNAFIVFSTAGDGMGACNVAGDGMNASNFLPGFTFPLGFYLLA